jgi:hypothetical protein
MQFNIYIVGGRVLAGGSSSCLKLYNYSGDLIQSINSFKNLYTVNVLKTIDTGIPSKMTLVYLHFGSLFFSFQFLGCWRKYRCTYPFKLWLHICLDKYYRFLIIF